MQQMRSEPRLRRHWLHASGGLIWHLRALRYRSSLWRNFRLAVRDWLHNWQPPTDKLLIVGPSAGYTLDDEFLQRWHEVAALEPDPLARWLLRRRYPTVRWRFESLDLLSTGDKGFDLLAHHFARHAILFANVLGQVVPREEGAALRWNLALRTSLRAHHWASYHDVISTERAPEEALAQWSGVAANPDEVLSHFWRGGEMEVVDHCTFGLGESGTHLGTYCVWPLRPHHHHLVEWLTEVPVQTVAATPAE